MEKSLRVGPQTQQELANEKILTDRQRLILRIIFGGDRASHWIIAIENESLSANQIEEACELLSGEFHMNGIDANFEANAYGKEIEALLDVVNRPRLK